MNNTSEALTNVTVTGWRPPPWYQFEACEKAPYAFIFYYGVKVLNMFVGTPTNIMVMWHIITHKNEGSTSDIFIFNLALLDSFFCLMTLVELLNRLVLNNDVIWYFQRFAYGVKDMTPLFLTCICLDRYIAVVHPIVFTGIRDNRIRFGISVFVWGLVLSYSLVKCFIGVMNVTEVFGGLILFAFFLMVFCNLSIIWVLRKSVAGKEVMNPVKKKAFKMVITLLVIIVVNYLPPVALIPFSSAFTFVDFRCKISLAVFSIMDLSCTIEPLLYISKVEKLALCPCLKGPASKTNNVSG